MRLKIYVCSVNLIRNYFLDGLYYISLGAIEECRLRFIGFPLNLMGLGLSIGIHGWKPDPFHSSKV